MPTTTQQQPFAKLPDEIRGYRLRGLLGAGAMGAVYRAVASGGRRGLKDGDEVALKLLDPRFAPDAHVVRRFKREAGVGLGARHPGIAKVFEVGSLRGPTRGTGSRLHYIVQELLTGGSLQSRLEQEGPQPEPVVREVGRQVAETLAFVHGRNIVHRDLKPANLFLDERGLVKIVDFGLARLISEPLARDGSATRSASDSGVSDASDSSSSSVRSSTPPPSSGATSAGKFLGTVAYAAPEQLDGTPATPQSDLFALGLVLFEMATGAHPFARERDLGYDEYVAALASRDAPPLTDVRPELSWFLDRVVAKLLERSTAHRFATAAEVAEALSFGERSRFWRSVTAPVSPLVSSGRQRLMVRRTTRLVGRSRELALLCDEARAAFAGRGRTVVLEGAAGVGKTRLVDALAEWLERAGPRAFFLVLRAGETGGGREPLASPLAPVRELLNDAFGDLAAMAVGAEPSDAKAIVDQLFAGAGDAPLLFVADGLERLDAATLAVVQELQSRVDGRKAMLVATVANDVALPRSVARAVAAIERGATKLSLVGFELPAFQTLAHDLGLEPSQVDRVAAWLHELCAGSPGSAVELWSWLFERGETASLLAKRTTVATLPPWLSQRFARRLAPLTPAELAVVEAAAILGGDLRLQMLRDVLEIAPVDFDALLTRLEQERRLVERRSGQLRFCEPLLRRHVVNATPRARRRAVHLLAARHYRRELAQPSPAPRTALKAAIHANLAGERTILGETLRHAVRVLELEGALDRAWRLVASAEKSARVPPEDTRLLAQALVLRGTLAHRLGRREDERAIWSEAARLSSHFDDAVVKAQAFHGLGRLASRTGRFVAAESYLRSADESASRAPRGSGIDRSAIMLDLAEALLWSGDEERAAETLAQAEHVIDTGAAVSSIGRYFKERGNLLLELERFDEAGDAYSQGRSIVRGPALRPLHRALVLGSARLLREIADFDKARRACELARRSAESDLDLRHLAQAWYVIGDVEARAGEPDRAFLPFVKSLRLAARVEDDYMVVSALGSLSFLYRWKRFGRHSLEKAVRCARRAVSRARSMAVGRLEARGLAALALCYRDMRKMAWALAIARKAVREASAAGVRRRRAAEIYWVHGLILGEMGDKDAANASLDEARRRIERRLLGVASPAVRARMVERDPLLREIEATKF